MLFLYQKLEKIYRLSLPFFTLYW